MLPEKRPSVSPRKNDLEKRHNCDEDGATVKVSFSIRFATLREGIERNHGDNSKDKMCVVIFWKDGRPNSVEYFEHHGEEESPPSSGRAGTTHAFRRQ